MAHSDPKTPDSGEHSDNLNHLVYQIAKRIESTGTPDENNLFQRWLAEINRYFQQFSQPLKKKEVLVEFGIENGLALNINLRSSTLPPFLQAHDFFQNDYTLSRWMEFIQKNQLVFHSGVRITSNEITYKLYVYDRDNRIGESGLLTEMVQTHYTPENTLLVTISNSGRQTLFNRETHNDRIEKLASTVIAELKETHYLVGEELTFLHNRRIITQSGIEIWPAPLALQLQLLSRYNFPYFKYLFPKKDLKSFLMAFDHSNPRNVSFYAVIDA